MIVGLILRTVGTFVLCVRYALVGLGSVISGVSEGGRSICQLLFLSVFANEYRRMLQRTAACRSKQLFYNFHFYSVTFFFMFAFVIKSKRNKIIKFSLFFALAISFFITLFITLSILT